MEMLDDPEIFIIVYSMQLVKQNTSNAVADIVRAMIVEGELADGQRINEVRLAKKLGVSRTPLREALALLTAEGAVYLRTHHGAYVCPLSRKEYDELRQIRPLLDPEALRLSGIPDKSRIEQLDAMNQELVSISDPTTAVTLDNRWHLALVADCPNAVLIQLIEQMMQRMRRYEVALFRETRNTFRAGNEHEQIIRALESRDLRRACRILKQNMQSDAELVSAWLAEREGGQEDHLCA